MIPPHSLSLAPLPLPSAFPCIFLCGMPLTALSAQGAFELRHEGLQQEFVTLADGGSIRAELSDYEIAGILRDSAVGYTAAWGYDPEVGLYHDRAFDRPLHAATEWLPHHIARIEQRGDALTAYDAAGGVIERHEVDVNASEVSRLTLQAAAAGTFHPFLQQVLPTQREMDRLAAEGYIVSTSWSGEGAAARRSSAGSLLPGVYGGILLAAGDGTAGDSVVTARAPDHIVRYDAGVNTQSYTELNDAGEPIAHSTKVYGHRTLADGARALVLLQQVEATLDTLLSGAVVAIYRVDNRYGHEYERDGQAWFASQADVDGVLEGLAVFPNPLRDRQLHLSLPQLDSEHAVNVRLTDPSGRVMLDRVLAGDAALQSVDLPSELPAGAYALRSCRDGDCVTHKLLVQ